MTKDEVLKRVKEIEKSGETDDEAAHSEEDELRTDVLKAIASGCENAQELAETALLTEEMDFARWCA